MGNMDKRFDISEFVDAETEQTVLADLVRREKLRRKEFGLTQRELAAKSGVSYASVRRFEAMGDISLASLLKIGNALGFLSDFDGLFKNRIITDLKDYKI